MLAADRAIVANAQAVAQDVLAGKPLERTIPNTYAVLTKGREIQESYGEKATLIHDAIRVLIRRGAKGEK